MTNFITGAVNFITVICSLGTVFFMWRTFSAQREHNIKSVKPFVTPVREITDDQISLSIRNAGLGPAIIHAIKVSIKGNEKILLIQVMTHMELFVEKIIKGNFNLHENSINYSAMSSSDGQISVKSGSDFEIFNIDLRNESKEDKYRICQFFKQISFDSKHGGLYDKDPDFTKMNTYKNIEEMAESVKNNIIDKMEPYQNTVV